MHRREADILQDLSITHWRQGDLDEAEQNARQACDRAEEAGFYYLLSKAQWTLGDIAFARTRYIEAFREYAQACINITKLDPVAMGHESAKKTLHYEDLVDHVEEQILQIPEYAQVQEVCRILVERWQKEGMTARFPGFIERIKAIAPAVAQAVRRRMEAVRGPRHGQMHGPRITL